MKYTEEEHNLFILHHLCKGRNVMTTPTYAKIVPQLNKEWTHGKFLMY